MKKLKFLLPALIIMLTMLCCACGLLGRQKYVCDADMVESIQIVELGKWNNEIWDFEHFVLAEVTDISSFAERLNMVKHSVNWGEPIRFQEGNIIIKICYLNGNIDEIYHLAQNFYISANMRWNDGFFIFDEEQFESLISDYLTKSA